MGLCWPYLPYAPKAVGVDGHNGFHKAAVVGAASRDKKREDIDAFLGD